MQYRKSENGENADRELRTPAVQAQATVTERFRQPTAREAALVVLHLLRTKALETGKEVTRARLTEITLRRLWARTRISNELISEVQEYLLHAGWVLFWAGSSYAVIQVSSVEGWARLSSKRINEDLAEITSGKFDFDRLEPLLLSGARRSEQDADE
jgi:hypothetical protein